MSTKIILLDLDGTLLDSQKRLSPANRGALERCAAKGIHIVPSTGRFYAGMPEVIRTLPFVRYVVAVNGAQVYDAAQQKVLHRAEMPLELALRIYDRLDMLPVIYECFLDDWGYMPKAHHDRIDEFITGDQTRTMIRTLRKPVEDFRGLLVQKNHALQKIQMFFRDPQARLDALDTLPRVFPETAVSSSIAGAVEMTDRAATKGEALRFLCRCLDVDIQDTMSFGDNSNDLSMIEAAGVGVAMANADPELREIADYVTDTNDDDGVAKALEHFGL